MLEDYNFWIKDFEYTNINESVIEDIDNYIRQCNERGLHVCLNLHRAPGYCVNRNDLEKDDLWKDKPAQNGFVFNWEFFARRYKGISSEKLSFNY